MRRLVVASEQLHAAATSSRLRLDVTQDPGEALLGRDPRERAVDQRELGADFGRSPGARAQRASRRGVRAIEPEPAEDAAPPEATVSLRTTIWRSQGCSASGFRSSERSRSASAKVSCTTPSASARVPISRSAVLQTART